MRAPISLMLSRVLLALLATACTRPNPGFRPGVGERSDGNVVVSGGGGAGGNGGGSGGAGGSPTGEAGADAGDGAADDLRPSPPDGSGGAPVGDAGPDVTADVAVDGPGDLPPAPPSPAAAAHWTLDSTVVNQRNGTAGALSGTATWSAMSSPGSRASNSGSLSLNGGVGHARLGITGLPRYESAKTVSLWFWTASALGTTSGRKYLLVMTSSSAGAALELLLINGAPTAFIGGTEAGGTDIISSVRAHAGWNHLVYTFDPSAPAGTNMNTVYVDTVVGRTRQMALRSGPVAEALLGTVEPGQAETTNFQGLIDEVRIYDRALSPAEITALFNGAP